jgi:hypothetical protein
VPGCPSDWPLASDACVARIALVTRDIARFLALLMSQALAQVGVDSPGLLEDALVFW